MRQHHDTESYRAFQPSVTRGEAGSLFGQTMALVAVTSGLFALGAYLGRGLSGAGA